MVGIVVGMVGGMVGGMLGGMLVAMVGAVVGGGWLNIEGNEVGARCSTGLGFMGRTP